jgi:hypothetical protein
MGPATVPTWLHSIHALGFDDSRRFGTREKPENRPCGVRVLGICPKGCRGFGSCPRGAGRWLTVVLIRRYAGTVPLRSPVSAGPQAA